MSNTIENTATATAAAQTADKAASAPQTDAKATTAAPVKKPRSGAAKAAQRTKAQGAAKGKGTTPVQSPRKGATAQARKAAAAVPSKAQARKEIAEAASKLPIVKAYGSEDRKSPYSVFRLHDAFAAYTIAAAVTAGMVQLSAKGTATVPKGKAYPGLFRSLVGITAWQHWRKLGRIADGAFTATGLNEIAARLSGQSRGYNTDRAMVDAFTGAMKKGGKLEHAGRRFAFTVEHGSSN